jgi:dethiobiotin synthetase
MGISCFVTGTDTGIGKTWISAGLLCAMRASGLRVAGMKPVASGCRRTRDGLRNEDAEILQFHSSAASDYHLVNPVALPDAVAPHIAAARSGMIVDLAAIHSAYLSLRSGVDAVVVEGVGGWRVPLTGGRQIRDLVRMLELPVLVVVGLRLGCINHTLLTVESLLGDQVPLAGWVANGLQRDFAEAPEVVNFLCERIPAPLIGTVPFMEELQADRIGMHLATDLLAPG